MLTQASPCVFFFLLSVSIEKILAAIVGIVFVFCLAYQFVEMSLKEEEVKGETRFLAYLVCFLSIFFLSVVFAGMISAPVMPGDEDESGHVATEYHPGKSCEEQQEIAQQFFLFMIVPAMLGVRFALPKKKEGNNRTSK